VSLEFSDHVTLTETEYGVILLDQKQGRYWRLNPTAALVVNTLRDGGDRQDAARRVAEIFDVDRRRAEDDIADLVAGMRAAGVIRP
jgi:hypothetical protein